METKSPGIVAATRMTRPQVGTSRLSFKPFSRYIATAEHIMSMSAITQIKLLTSCNIEQHKLSLLHHSTKLSTGPTWAGNEDSCRTDGYWYLALEPVVTLGCKKQ